MTLENTQQWLLKILSQAPLTPSLSPTGGEGAIVRERDYAKTGYHLEAAVSEEKILPVARYFHDQKFFLECLTCVDYTHKPEDPHFIITYQFNRWEEVERILLKLKVPKQVNEAPSIAPIIPAANWYEREVFDMYGVRFSGHPKLERLLLPLQSKIHPLLKSYTGLGDSDVRDSLELIESDQEVFDFTVPEQMKQSQKEYYLNLGPQHPSTHGVLRVLLHLDGEKIISGEPIIGYAHRAHEKMAEVHNYLQFWPNTGRLDYVGAMSYNFCYALAVEKAMGIVPSPRVEYIRVITTELNRISSHLLWLGTYLLDLGAFTPFFYAFDEREKTLDLLELCTGERLTYDYFRFGGVLNDVPQEMIDGIKKFIPEFRKRLRDYRTLITENIIFIKRTKGIGVLTLDAARDYGVTGPSLRACGIAYDLRRAEPYSIYQEFDFEIPTQHEGDAYARYLVRMAEMEQSLRILEQAIARIPAGEYQSGKIPKAVPVCEIYQTVESARGQFGIYLVSDGTQVPYRLKLRTPSFSNLNALGPMAKGHFVSDAVSILGSIDIVVPEIDR